jgi:hypothetical protein
MPAGFHVPDASALARRYVGIRGSLTTGRVVDSPVMARPGGQSARYQSMLGSPAGQQRGMLGSPRGSLPVKLSPRGMRAMTAPPSPGTWHTEGSLATSRGASRSDWCPHTADWLMHCRCPFG